jgi:hypothetical protein
MSATISCSVATAAITIPHARPNPSRSSPPSATPHGDQDRGSERDDPDQISDASDSRTSSHMRWLRQRLDLPSRPLLLTFDDAHADSWTGGDGILHRLGFNAVMFVDVGHATPDPRV